MFTPKTQVALLRFRSWTIDEPRIIIGREKFKRAVKIGNRKTSVSLEQPFWDALKEIADARKVTLYQLVSMIDAQREADNLSASLRIAALDYYRDRAKISLHADR